MLLIIYLSAPVATTKIYSADKIFTGENWLNNHAIIVSGNRIETIVPVSSLTSAQHIEQFDNCIIAPAFIDLQIYGAYGKLLAVYPEVDSLYKLKEYCEKGGAAFCLPTVATNTKEVFYKSIDAVKEYWSKGGEGILGLHLEGPWINPAKRGAHIEALIHPPTIQETEELLNYGIGVIRMITLAPEVCTKEILDLILSHHIIISAGHSNATYAEAKTGFSNGITAVTHLYNAMSPLQHRQPGLVGAAMDDATVMASIIPDGHHVDYAAIRIAKQVMKERLFVITDAVTETTKGHYQHQPVGDKYEADNILSGSALTMAKAVQNLVNFGAIELGEALRMCSLYPAKVLGLKELGKIDTGYNARMVVLDDQMEVKQLL
ncbi:MAG: N-acetylglucosamine-6-phosphate deacetylase [Chitinophagaceae bacterium]|nr:N-acetylglucosamine-6-phosphate deacetylase [Chitinophagaceae bacterium]